MREEEFRVAACTPTYNLNRPGLKSGIQQLPPIRLHQVKVNAWPHRRVPWRPLGQKQHRILAPNRVRIVHLAE